MAKLFTDKGWLFVRGGKGSHMKLKREGKPTIIIPDDRELKRGLEHALRKILDQHK